MSQILLGRVLLASLFVGILGVGGALIIDKPVVDMHMEPASGTYVAGDTFVTHIIVESENPVNVFKGNLQFDKNILAVEKIDYNTSIANLWAQLPWYSNGEGTLNFIGGTTQPGGFSGKGTLITITFKTIAVGTAVITMDDIRILQHDGLGTDAEVAKPIDALFTVSEEEINEKTVLQKSALGPKVHVVEEAPSTDLNGDGKQTIADVSIFMGHLITQELRSDFNGDGKISTADLSILLDAQ